MIWLNLAKDIENKTSTIYGRIYIDWMYGLVSRRRQTRLHKPRSRQVGVTNQCRPIEKAIILQDKCEEPLFCELGD